MDSDYGRNRWDRRDPDYGRSNSKFDLELISNRDERNKLKNTLLCEEKR